MRRLLILGILCLAGCQNVLGPLDYRKPVRVDDPCLPISEQQKLGRDRLAVPDEGFVVGPPSGLIPPGAPLHR
jgi:hypothetical protein